MVEKWRSVFLFVLFTVCILGWQPSCINGATDPSDGTTGFDPFRKCQVLTDVCHHNADCVQPCVDQGLSPDAILCIRNPTVPSINICCCLYRHT